MPGSGGLSFGAGGWGLRVEVTKLLQGRKSLADNNMIQEFDL